VIRLQTFSSDLPVGILTIGTAGSRGDDFLNQAALRQWLADEGVTGYPQQLLVWERFGYPAS